MGGCHVPGVVLGARCSIRHEGSGEQRMPLERALFRNNGRPIPQEWWSPGLGAQSCEDQDFSCLGDLLSRGKFGDWHFPWSRRIGETLIKGLHIFNWTRPVSSRDQLHVMVVIVKILYSACFKITKTDFKRVSTTKSDHVRQCTSELAWFSCSTVCTNIKHYVAYHTYSFICQLTNIS